MNDLPYNGDDNLPPDVTPGDIDGHYPTDDGDDCERGGDGDDD